MALTLWEMIIINNYSLIGFIKNIIIIIQSFSALHLPSPTPTLNFQDQPKQFDSKQ